MKLLIPPPLYALAAGVAIWALQHVLPGLNTAFPGQSILAWSLIAVGVGIGVIAVGSFFQTGTTISPHTPQKTASLVTGGLYSFSRNPMYLAMLLVLVGYALGRGNPLGMLPVVAFVIIIEAVQIRPEEAVLEEKFGEDYRAYKARVRRWL